MPKFSSSSLEKLKTCDPRLQEILNDAIKHYDFTILHGHRSEAEQNTLKELGLSKLEWPNSKHNSIPSKAVDIVSTPIKWNDMRAHFFLAGLIFGIAKMKGINIRMGVDFNRNFNFGDDSFLDAFHFELID